MCTLANMNLNTNYENSVIDPKVLSLNLVMKKTIMIIYFIYVLVFYDVIPYLELAAHLQLNISTYLMYLSSASVFEFISASTSIVGNYNNKPV